MPLLIPTLGTWYTSLFLVLFVIVCVFMMLVILIQKPRGGGLSGAFGGAGGSSSSVFGSKTGDVLTWFTVICFCLFVGLAMALTWTIKGEVGPTTDPTNTVLPAKGDVIPGDKDGGTDKDGFNFPSNDGDKDGAPKDGAAKDGTAKDGATKDAAAKDGAAKDGVTKDAATKDAATKDATDENK